jgi:type II secretory pathway pseudopilin PulG
MMIRLNQRGFTFLALVFAIVLIGISLSVAVQQWKMIVQREKEADLLYRGDQIKHAIEAYYRGTPGVSRYPSCGDEYDDCFKELLGDPQNFKKRYLRKIYKDPMTNGDWLLIKSPDGKLMGVRSKSTKEPIKKANFPEEYKCFEQAMTYSDWVFQFIPALTPSGSPQAAQPCTVPPKTSEEKPSS